MIKKYCYGFFLTNTYLIIKGTECVIVDPGLGFDEYVKEVNEKYNVIGILLTHGHIDHIASIGQFMCPIYISLEEQEFLKNENLSLAAAFNNKHSFNYDSLDLHFVRDEDVITLNEMNFLVIATPGHTKGSVCYLYEDRLFSGDTLFSLSQGRTDFPTGDEKKMKESLKKIITMLPDNTIVYPGHDEKTTIKTERKNNPYVIRALKNKENI